MTHLREFIYWYVRRPLQKLPYKIAAVMPRWLVYHCAIRLIANASGSKYPNQVVPELTAVDALKRWRRHDPNPNTPKPGEDGLPDDVIGRCKTLSDAKLLECALQVYARACMYGTKKQHDAAMAYKAELLRRLAATEQPGSSVAQGGCPKDADGEDARFVKLGVFGYVRADLAPPAPAAHHIVDINEKGVAAPAAEQGDSSLLRKPGPLPAGCYCKPGRCMAPVVMGRQTACRDQAKAATPTPSGVRVDAAMVEYIGNHYGIRSYTCDASGNNVQHRAWRFTPDQLCDALTAALAGETIKET